MKRDPIIWLLLGDKTGDNNQLLALADRLDVPVVPKRLSYNLGRAVAPRFLGTSRLSLTADAKAQLTPPWPDLVIAIGRRSVPTARWLKRHHGTRTVLVGHPRVDPRHFDLVITTRQYPVPQHDNVVVLPMPLSRLHAPTEQSDSEREILASLARPHLLLALGGPTKSWTLECDAARDATRRLISRAEQTGGTLLAIGSRRTPSEVVMAVRSEMAGTDHLWIENPSIRFSTLLHDADEIFVTADSISMLSEAIQTGKPVGLIPISMTTAGRRRLGDANEPRSHRTRDLRKIWSYLVDTGLVGTIDNPLAGNWSSGPVDSAVAAVRKLIEREIHA